MSYLIAIVTSATLLPGLYAHPSWTMHAVEMYSVLPFEADGNGKPVAADKPVYAWLKTISSELIDKYKGEPCEEFGGMCFYDYLKENYGFACKHRLLFHWGFNSVPWSEALDAKISRYSWSRDTAEVARFKECFKKEQKRRNSIANSLTEEVFGLASSGKEAGWANAIIAIMYDIHLLGDFNPETNSDFDGVSPPSKVAGDIIRAVRKLDPPGSRELIRKIDAAVREQKMSEDDAAVRLRQEQFLSVKLISLLQEELPVFLLEASDGALKEKFIAKGYVLKSDL